MYLSEVSIEGFRCFKSATFSFQRGFNAIAGRNNTGKTSVFNAIRHALGSSASRGEVLWLSEDDFYRDKVTGKRQTTMKVELSFDGLTQDDRARFFELLDYDAAAPEKSKARVTFEASWPQNKRHADTKRWGGESTSDRAAAPPEVLAQIPITFLPALRDAEAALTPGNKSRLALLLQDLARRDLSDPATGIVAIFQKANAELEKSELLKKVRTSLRGSTEKMAGTDYAPCSIAASAPRFDRILRTLRVQMEGVALEEISANGLGYNNLLYVATVLAHLEQIADDEVPLLLVEEPEAHLHPQLTILLAEYLNVLTAEKRAPQVIVTTHSPTLASHLPPSRISITYYDRTEQLFQCNALVRAGLSAVEEREVRRMLDVTRATLYFAKGLILVEGISEALLLPALSERLGCDLLARHISILPMCGVAFGTFHKILAAQAVNIPVAIITDGDPAKTTTDWKTAEPAQENGSFQISARTKALIEQFRDRTQVKVFASKVTLEYDLAAAGPGNAPAMTGVWASCFVGQPRTLNATTLAEAGNDLTKQALAVWRGICVAETSGSKAEFANKLADHLSLRGAADEFSNAFEVPSYLADAVRFVWSALDADVPATSELAPT